MKRIEKFINRDWKFDYGENELVERDETLAKSFYEIGLPHTFSLPYKGGSDFYIGYGVYTKKINIEKNHLDKWIALEFEGVFQVAEVYLNGEFIMRHEGGYTAFLAELSGKCKEGENYLVVRVNNKWSPIIAPRAGEHTFAGGIYRDVKLLISEVSHIAWQGTFVKTTIVSEKKAEVIIETETIKAQGLQLVTKLCLADGTVLDTKSVVVDSEKCLQKFIIEKPFLWSTDTPYLYSIVSVLGDDAVVTNFGVRSIEWDAKKGFFLNGKRLLISGANVHQDRGGWGDAATHSGIKRDIKMMKDCGMNFIRGSHYPHHRVFAQECDRQGILFWSESVFWGIGGFGDDGYWDASAMPTQKEHYEGFEQSLRQTLREMIMTNRNSPSVIAWSMGNEIFFSKKSVMEDAKAMLGRMVEYSHELDYTRPAAIGGVQREGFDEIGDIAGYNGDGAVHFKSPKLANMVAEYGSIASHRPGKYSLYETKGSAEYYDWRAGRAIWCGFHHGSIASIGNLGIVDLYRLPLNAWYAYREKSFGIAPPKAKEKGKPTSLRLTADKKVITSDGRDDCMLTVELLGEKGERISNEIEVELEITKGGGLLPTGKKMTFKKSDKSFFDGACAIEMRSYYALSTTVVARAEGVRSGEIEIMVEGDVAYDGREIIMPKEPSCEKRKLGRGADIVANRPVTASSSAGDNVGENVSDGQKQTYWQAEVQDKKPSLTLDLENLYEDFSIALKLKKRNNGKLTLTASIDGEVWREIEETNFSIFKKQYKFQIKKDARYLKLAFKGMKKPIMVEEIKGI